MTHQFEEGELHEIDELPENQMEPNGKVMWVDDDTLALYTDDCQVVEFEMAVRVTDVKYLDDETGDIYETREQAGAEL